MAEGTRRDAAVAVDAVDVAVDPDDATSLLVSFGLPSGAYATVIMRELQKTDAAPEVPS